jgi:hypothetical protein
MHHAFIRLVDSQAGRLLDVTPQTGVWDALLPGLEGTDNAAAHADTTRLAEGVVRSIDENLGPGRQAAPSEAALARWLGGKAKCFNAEMEEADKCRVQNSCFKSNPRFPTQAK